MALSFSLETDVGVPANYHRITGLQSYYNDRCADVTVAGYTDKAARQAGKRPLTARTIRVSFEDVGDEPGRLAVYGALKTLPEFAGSVDC
jgi:hypothetical protein